MIGTVRALGARVPQPSFDVASLTDRGLMRSDNQDNLAIVRDALTFCVADGVGGGDGGALASAMLCEEMSSAAKASQGFMARLKACDDAARVAHEKIADYAMRAGFKRAMGTTMALFLIDPDHVEPGGWRSAAVAHIGDSRVYRWREGVLELLTHDHTLGEEMLNGTLPTDGAGGRRSVLAHMLTRAIGPGDWIGPDWRKVDARPGDAFLLCSDGVHDMMPDIRILSAFEAGGSARVILARLESAILAAGAADNYTMIVIRVI